MEKFYSTIFIVDISQNPDEVETVASRIQQLIEDHGGIIKKIDRWGKKRLAYQIDKKSHGSYVEIEFNANSRLNIPKILDNEYRLNDRVLRSLTYIIGKMELRQREIFAGKFKEKERRQAAEISEKEEPLREEKVPLVAPDTPEKEKVEETFPSTAAEESPVDKQEEIEQTKPEELIADMAEEAENAKSEEIPVEKPGEEEKVMSEGLPSDKPEEKEKTTSEDTPLANSEEKKKGEQEETSEDIPEEAPEVKRKDTKEENPEEAPHTKVEDTKEEKPEEEQQTKPEEVQEEKPEKK